MKTALLLPVLCWTLLNPAAAQAPAGETGMPAIQRVQKTVQALLPQVRPAVVAILTGDGTASGVIMNADGLVLTAAHVAERPGRTLQVVLDDGSVVQGLTLGLDKTTDAALLQLRDSKRRWPHVAVSRQVSHARPGDWCFALGHPGGFDKSRGVVLRVGRVIKQTANSLQTDCVLMGGDSGGPLFNLQGEVIGVHSLIWEARDENMHVSMAPFLRAWEDMKSSRVIHVWSTGSGGYLGVATALNAGGGLEVLDVLAGSPSAQAGLKAGDVILSLDGEAMTEQAQFSNAVRMRAAGDRVRLGLRSPGGPREITVQLGTRPKEEG